MTNIEKQTQTNIQEKASLIWNIANNIFGLYKPHEYGKVILPLTVIKRFNDTLLPTHDKVLAMNKQCEERNIQVKSGFLEKASGYKFYNTSVFTFEKLLNDPDNIEANLRSYIASFSDNVIDILENFEFDKEITKLANADYLYTVIQEFCTEKAYMGADKISSTDMGYIFEELIRKFSESYNEEAGAHFTARDIIYLMTDLLVEGDKDSLNQEVVTKTAYDMAMGTSQMLGCLTERIKQINEDAEVNCFGQELNPETFAIAKADMIIKGGNPDDMKQGDTLSNDQFQGYQFDYIISNPPFGIDWKVEEKVVKEENEKGENGRFPYLPPISDGQMLFMQNGIAKLKDTGRMTIIQNASPLFSGDAGSGQSNIRGMLLENDWLETIIQLPADMFYNTGISTYIWVITKNKSEERCGKVQLIDASNCFVKRRKSIGSKKNDLDEECLKLILQAYNEFSNKEYSYKSKSYDKSYNLVVKSRIFDNIDFKYKQICINIPLYNNGNIVKKKEKVVVNKKASFKINLPFTADVDKYFDEHIKPDFEDAFYVDNETVIGYEIPFVRIFHELEKIRDSVKIFNELNELDKIQIDDKIGLLKDNDVKFKKTGIKFIPEIPENWEITTVRNLFNIANEKAEQEEPTVLTLARSGIKIRDISTNEGQLAENYNNYNPVRPKDLLLNPMDLISGDNCSVSYVEGVISPAYINLRAKDGVDSEFYNYYFKCQYWLKAMFEQGKGVSFDNRWTMNKDTCMSYFVPKVSKEEQTRIAKEIKRRVKDIDSVIELEEKKIEKLKELKKAVMFEIISGKKEV